MNDQRGTWAPVVGLLALACAQATPPPGGTQDLLPPRIIETTPDTLAVVESLDGPVVFRFNERISERNITDRSVMVSPRTGEVEVKRGRDEIRVEIEGGWQPGLVYRVLLLPGVRDMFGNELKQPSELVFSTGPDISGAVIAGVVTERATGRPPAQQAFIEATNQADSVTYVTAVDSSSFYAFRHMSPGVYELMAFADGNRNGERDEREASSLPVVRSVNRDLDTLVVELAVVPADTTPPRLTRAEARDTLELRLFSDDYLEPDADIGSVQVTIRTLPDSVEVPGPHAVMTVDSFNALPQPEPDSLPGDSIAADTAAQDTAAQDSVPPAAAVAGRRGLAQVPFAQQRLGRGGPGRSGASEFGAPEGPLPFKEFVLIPSTPLTAGAKYLISVEGLTNISGRSNGGGEVEFEVPEPPPPPPDTSQAKPPPDTSRARLRSRAR